MRERPGVQSYSCALSSVLPLSAAFVQSLAAGIFRAYHDNIRSAGHQTAMAGRIATLFSAAAAQESSSQPKPD